MRTQRSEFMMILNNLNHTLLMGSSNTKVNMPKSKYAYILGISDYEDAYQLDEKGQKYPIYPNLSNPYTNVFHAKKFFNNHGFNVISNLRDQDKINKSYALKGALQDINFCMNNLILEA